MAVTVVADAVAMVMLVHVVANHRAADRAGDGAVARAVGRLGRAGRRQRQDQ